MVERLTHELAGKARAHIQEVEALGGMTAAIEQGLPKLRIEECAARTQARIDSGRQVVVGVNRWRPSGEAPVELLRVDNAKVREAQLSRLAELKRSRDPKRVEAALARLTEGARGAQNLLALSIEAVRAQATVGEISSALEVVFGRYEAVPQTITGVYRQEVGSTAQRTIFAGCFIGN